jgi:MarR-like DNA-binding transcriptional regulator SgrR of sgrS sRNA
MGGQWQNDSPVLRIPYYRPLESTEPRHITGRDIQHLQRVGGIPGIQLALQ